MTETMRYRIVIDGGRDSMTGSDLLSIAHGYIDHTAGERCVSTTPRYDGEHDLILIDASADSVENLEERLEDDDRVLSYAQCDIDVRE